MSDHEGDPFDRIERLLAEQQTKLYELGELVGEYRRLVADARDKPTADAVRLARGLPGARYLKKAGAMGPRLILDWNGNYFFSSSTAWAAARMAMGTR